MAKTKAPPKCPEGYRPGCDCSSQALEPNESCYYHGYPDVRRCPYCGQMRGFKPCKRCGCVYGIEHWTANTSEE